MTVRTIPLNAVPMESPLQQNEPGVDIFQVLYGNSGLSVVTDGTNLEAPHLRKAYGLLMEKRGTRPFLSRQDIDPIELAFTLPNIGLVDVHREPLRFFHRLAGTNWRPICGFEPQGTWLDTWPPHQQMIIANSYRAVLETGQILTAQRRMLLDKRPFFYEVLLIPLSKDGVEISMIFAAIGPFTKATP